MRDMEDNNKPTLPKGFSPPPKESKPLKIMLIAGSMGYTAEAEFVSPLQQEMIESQARSYGVNKIYYYVDEYPVKVKHYKDNTLVMITVLTDFNYGFKTKQ